MAAGEPSRPSSMPERIDSPSASRSNGPGEVGRPRSSARRVTGATSAPAEGARRSGFRWSGCKALARRRVSRQPASLRAREGGGRQRTWLPGEGPSCWLVGRARRGDAADERRSRKRARRPAGSGMPVPCRSASPPPPAGRPPCIGRGRVPALSRARAPVVDPQHHHHPPPPSRSPPPPGCRLAKPGPRPKGPTSPTSMTSHGSERASPSRGWLAGRPFLPSSSSSLNTRPTEGGVGPQRREGGEGAGPDGIRPRLAELGEAGWACAGRTWSERRRRRRRPSGRPSRASGRGSRRRPPPPPPSIHPSHTRTDPVAPPLLASTPLAREEGGRGGRPPRAQRLTSALSLPPSPLRLRQQDRPADADQHPPDRARRDRVDRRLLPLAPRPRWVAHRPVVRRARGLTRRQRRRRAGGGGAERGRLGGRGGPGEGCRHGRGWRAGGER